MSQYNSNKEMKETKIIKIAFYMILLTAMALVVAGCVEKQSRSGTFIGETKSLGNGMVRSWITLDDDGNASAIGVTFTEMSLSGLPIENSTEYMLALPEQASATPFNHIGLDWNPMGHVPPGIYDKPHFDFHFYMISPEERNSITATGEDMVKVSKNVSLEYIPEGYVPTPGGVPRMGAHWIDPTSPEFNNQSFTKTFIYGFYDGKMVFVEPMVTKAFLETRPNTIDIIKVPAKYPKKAYYPTRYRVTYDANTKEYSVSIEGMTLR
jgi:hypothetical protein